LIISRSILLKIITVAHKVVEKITTHIFYVQFFFENRNIYEIKWENIAEPDRPQIKMRRMRISHRAPKATN